MSVEEIIAAAVLDRKVGRQGDNPYLRPSIADAKAILAALDAAGYVVVPKEATAEMVAAAIRAPRGDYWPGHKSPPEYYRAMIASRPKP